MKIVIVGWRNCDGKNKNIRRARGNHHFREFDYNTTKTVLHKYFLMC